MKATLPGGMPRSVEDLLNDFEARFAGLHSIARTTLNFSGQLNDEPGLKSFLGMGEKTAMYVDSLFDEYDEMRELIFQRLDRNDREKEPAEEATDA